MLSSIQLCSAALGAAPVLFETTSPSLKMKSAGIPRIPNCTAELGLLSTSTLATLTLPFISAAISSSAGPICLQGPHHSAQKSTTTGISEFFTSASKVSSVTATVAMGFLLTGVCVCKATYVPPADASSDGRILERFGHKVVGQCH